MTKPHSRACSGRSPSRRGGAVVKLLIAAVVLAGVGGGGYALYASRGTEDKTTAVELYTVARMSFQMTSTANGELKAKQQTEITSPLEAESSISEIVEEGVIVKEGDVLVKLNTDELQKQLDEESLALESAKADMISAENAYEIQVSDNESTIRKSQTKVEISQIELQKWLQGDVVEKRKDNASKIESATREVERLKKNLEQSRELHAKQFVSTNDLEKDELAYIEKMSDLEIAKLKSNVYEEFTYRQEEKKFRSELDDANAELERAKRKAESELASKSADRTNKRQQLTMRQNKVDKLKKQIDSAHIKAPTGGLIVYSSSVKPEWYFDQRGPIKVGRKVFPNESIIVLPDTSEMIAAIKVHESLISQITPGLPALITIDAKQGGKFTGKVDSIGIMAESGGWRDPNLREYEVKIALELGDGEHGLKPSMRCEAQVVRDNVKDAIAVPIQSVFNEGAVQYVYQEAGGKYERKPVRIGRRSDTHAEILAGLIGGEAVLLRTPEPGRIVKGEFDPKVLAALGIDTEKKGGPKMVLASMGGEAKPAAAAATTDDAADTNKAEGESADELDADEATDAEPAAEEAAETASAAPGQ